MKIEDEILINQYGQDLISIDILLNRFELLNMEQKRIFLKDILNLINQSKAGDGDIQEAIENSNLKSTYTPCVMLKKGIASHLLYKIIELPDNEIDKVLVLLISLFKIAYKRRFKLENNNPNKWWYWDLSDRKKVELILNQCT
ncbi:MAG: DUF5958 family protein [Oscillospiraceae bacterium]|nr:DUF5958 family protein [Oscillospiraceae bacterium]